MCYNTIFKLRKYKSKINTITLGRNIIKKIHIYIDYLFVNKIFNIEKKTIDRKKLNIILHLIYIFNHFKMNSWYEMNCTFLLKISKLREWRIWRISAIYILP